MWVVKAEIHAGGRGKEKLRGRRRGQGRRAHRQVDRSGQDGRRADARQHAGDHRDRAGGRVVKRVFVEDGSAIERELYRPPGSTAHLASRLDRLDLGWHGHREGGARDAGKIFTLSIDPATGYGALRRAQDRSGPRAESCDEIDECVKLIGALLILPSSTRT